MARTRNRPSGLKYTTIKQFQMIRKELNVDGDVLSVIGNFIGFKMPMTQAHYLTFKLNKEFHGRFLEPAQPDTLFLVWKRWDLRYKKNNHGWRHCTNVSGASDKYERVQYSRYKANNWVPIYDGDRCTPTFYDRLKGFRDCGRCDPRIRTFDAKYSYGAAVKAFNHIAYEGNWGADTPYESKNESRFYHGIHNLAAELGWLSHYANYMHRCHHLRGWQAGMKDCSTMINLSKMRGDSGWNGLFIRYDIPAHAIHSGAWSDWG